MIRRSCPLGLLFSFIALLTSLAHATPLVQGKVVNQLTVPLKGATVSLSGLGSTTTDSSGNFLLFPAPNALRPTFRSPAVPSIQFIGSEVTLRNVSGKKVSAILVDALGRTVRLVDQRTMVEDQFRMSLLEKRVIGSGMHIVRIHVEGHLYQAKCVIAGSKVLWQNNLGGVLSEPISMIGSSSAGVLEVSSPGYQSQTVPLARDTTFGLIIMLYPTGMERPLEIAVIESTETRGFRTMVKSNTTSPYAWAGNSGLHTYLNYFTTIPLAQNTVQRTFKVVHLDNGLIRVTIAPDLGMRVIRVRDKTMSPEREMFDILDNPANFTEFAQNIGGVKPSFPYVENSTGMIDHLGNLNCKAGYFIERHGNGGISVVMNLRFDYHQTEEDGGFTGKYGDQTLCGVVTLMPGHADFTIRYVADNPNPTRRSNRLWTCATLPNVYSTNGEWLFPVRYMFNHCCDNISGQSTNPVDISTIGLAGIKSLGSYFGLYTHYPFAGAYYGTPNACHLRISDNAKYPGIKVYNHSNNLAPFELWGGTNVLFEAPETFVNAFEPHDIVHQFYMARNIGKVTYANKYLAIASSGSSFSMTAPVMTRVTIYNVNQPTNPIMSDTLIGPGRKVTGTFSGGLRVVSGGTELCNVALPLTLPDNRAMFDTVRARARKSGCGGLSTLDTRYGEHYELEDIQSKNDLLSSMASLLAISNIRSSANPDSLLSLASTAYRLGGFSVAQRYCDSIGTRRPAQTKFLRSLMALELGQPADFSNTTIEGNYFSALQAIKAGQRSQAITHLDILISARPQAVRPRLLRAYLKNSVSDALTVYQDVPGSIELWTVLKELGYPGAADRLNKLVSPQNPSATVRMNDFLAEMKQGAWRHERRYEYDYTWYERVQMPPFPNELKY